VAEAMDDDHTYGLAKTRLAVLDAVLDALDRMDEINAIVRECPDRVTAQQELMAEPFGYSEFATHHVLDLTVGRQTVQGVEILRQERDEVAEFLKRLEDTA
jgi:DNA gyrase/topoisomerase IV subunit A